MKNKKGIIFANNSLDGYLTVEMCIIFPIIIILVLGIIYTSFYLHDVIVVNEKLREYEVIYNEKGSSTNNIKDNLERELKETMLIGKIIGLQLEEVSNKVIINLKIEYNILFLNLKINESYAAELEKLSRAGFMRKVKVLFDIISGLQEEK